jgi:hypothetical protein
LNTIGACQGRERLVRRRRPEVPEGSQALP